MLGKKVAKFSKQFIVSFFDISKQIFAKKDQFKSYYETEISLLYRKQKFLKLEKNVNFNLNLVHTSLIQNMNIF